MSSLTFDDRYQASDAYVAIANTTSPTNAVRSSGKSMNEAGTYDSLSQMISDAHY